MSKETSRSFVSAAKLIGVITLLSRFVGLGREMIAFRVFGDTGVWAAWKVAFTVPNLFRKLLGEGALSAAFIPLYAQAVKREEETRGNADARAATIKAETLVEGAHVDVPEERTPVLPHASNTGDTLTPLVQENAALFAAASVNLLAAILVVLTVVGELILLALVVLVHFNPNNALMLRLSMVMLPYVTLVCMTAFLGAILQVHHRFGAVAFTSVILNACLIVIIVALAETHDLSAESGQLRAAWWLSAGVLVAGVGQLAVLVPSLYRVGFRVRIAARIWSPAVRQMLILSAPVALGAGVLQIGVMLDKGIAQFLARQPGYETFSFFGRVVNYPIAEGAAARLDLAQYMYQFPLGVFAISLATAIFPRLGREALNPRGAGFGQVLRQGIAASLFIGLPASVGMILVARPALQLLFVGGRFTAASAEWVTLSLMIYSGAIWAFSLLQIVNRAYYALHDARTPLVWMTVNLLLNLVIEIPLLFTRLGESAMAVGTLVSFSVQAVAMLWLLDRRVGGVGLRQVAGPVGKMVVASAALGLACWGLRHAPLYPSGAGRGVWAGQLALMMGVGGVVYFGVCAALGLDVKKHLPRRRLAPPAPSSSGRGPG